MSAVKRDEDMEEAMEAGSSISTQAFQNPSKGKIFSEPDRSMDELVLAVGAETTASVAFVPFLVERMSEDGTLGATERDQLLMEHLPTVRYLARRIHERLPQHVDLDDLVSAGVVGLIDAFSKFDHSKKVQFKSYAQFRIRGAILDSLRTLDWSPRELRRKGRAVEEAMRSVTQRVGRAPSEQEIASEMELSLSDYQALLGDLKGLEIGSLHMERSEDSGDEELAYIPGSPEEDPLFRCLKGEMKQRLTDAIDELPEKERMVLTLYYYEELTMKEIGLTLGVVESRVSQIHSSAVVRLRVALAGLRTGGVSTKAKQKRSSH
jgi:RNA polymerase sigma factor for flagellar operon FliA